MFGKFLIVLVVAVVAWAVFVKPSDGASPERTYVVRASDTLWTIASANYAGDPREAVWRIQRRNDLEGTLLRPGQRLVLPAAG